MRLLVRMATRAQSSSWNGAGKTPGDYGGCCYGDELGTPEANA